MSIGKIEDYFLKITQTKIKKKSKNLGMRILLLGLLTFWIVFRSSILLEQLHLEWLVLGTLALGLWSSSQGLKWIAFILFCGGMLLAYHLFITMPAWQQKLQQANSPASWVWIRGKIIESSEEGDYVRLRLRLGEIHTAQEKQNFAEITVRFLFKRRSFQPFYRHRSLQFSGILEGAELQSQQLVVTIKQVHYHTTLVPPHPWFYLTQILHHHLGKRAAFYLSPHAYALYSPLILAKPVYRSEPMRLFRATGVAHLLTISGLHIGLLFWLGLLVFKQLGRFSEQLLLWTHFPRFCQMLTLATLWAYVTLLAFPIPALRALVMLSLMVMIRWLGQAQAPLYALLATAFLFISYDPAVIYNLSFQLSFIAVLYILLILPFLWDSSRSLPFWKKMLRNTGNSLLITGSVLVGLWPILVTHFQQLSLEVFWLNLILLPMLALLILPLGFAAVAISLLHYKSLPFGFLEKTTFQSVEWVLEGWLKVLQVVHIWGSWATFPVEISWEGWQYLLYYFVSFLVYYGLNKKFKSNF